jgi:hypothetical protein
MDTALAHHNFQRPGYADSTIYASLSVFPPPLSSEIGFCCHNNTELQGVKVNKSTVRID